MSTQSHLYVVISCTTPNISYIYRSGRPLACTVGNTMEGIAQTAASTVQQGPAMALEYHYDQQKQILRFTCSGKIQLAELQQAAAVITGSSDFPPDVATLWDCRAIDFATFEKDFEDGLIALRSGLSQRGAAKIAIVVAGDLAFGLSRKYELKSGRLPQSMMVYRDIGEAEAWLQLPLAQSVG